MADPPEGRSVVVTGAGGYIGRQLVAALVDAGLATVVAVDVREQSAAERLAGVTYRQGDVRRPGLADVITELVDDPARASVVHLAAIVTPGPGQSRQDQHEVDVGGTANVVQACVQTGVGQLVVTSSGAAYGYHADNPVPLTETDPLRGNPEFAYSDHKRQVEELLAQARGDHPGLRQLVFRPGAILGDATRNQITDLFHKKVLLGVAGSDSPFTFVWDVDVVAALTKGVLEHAEGVYNLAGDGMTTMPDIARRLGRRYLPLPAGLLKVALGVMHPLKLTQYGPEQVEFLQYRPVLANTALKEEFGYTPRLSSTEVFERYCSSHGL